jgi:hypothetical protein
MMMDGHRAAPAISRANEREVTVIDPLFRRPTQNEFDNLLEMLTTRQYLAPHEPLAQSLASTVDCLSVCPKAVEQALGRLQLDPNQSIGRLRRTELLQLARTVHRFWQQADPLVREPLPHGQS